VVASATDIQLWRGPIGDPFPARVLPWTTIATVGTPGRRGELSVVLTDGDNVLFRATNDRAFIPTYMGGVARGRLVATLLGLRSAPPGT
jgi:hypothetical protein